MQTNDLHEESFLPDFCRTPAIFSLLLISQTIALLLVLASSVDQFSFGPRMVLVSLYLHWISLLSAAALCWLRRNFSGPSVRIAALTAFCVLLGITILVSEVAFVVGRFLQWPGFIEPQAHLLFLGRNALICSIIVVVILRYFYVIHAWRRQVQASAEARFAALQARIRPHFFFNSLNSVAALIHSCPDQAEELIVDLSELFRAILKTHEPWNALSDEIELGRTYLRIEQLRLGDRLEQEWELPETLDLLMLPLLSLQPLLENAIYHGIERLPEGGTLKVTVTHEKHQLRVCVTNPVPLLDDERESTGHHMAHDNIRQRLRLLYDEEASLHTQRNQGEYRAELCVPL